MVVIIIALHTVCTQRSSAASGWLYNNPIIVCAALYFEYIIPKSRIRLLSGFINLAPVAPILSELKNVFKSASYQPSHTKMSASTKVIISPEHISTLRFNALGY